MNVVVDASVVLKGLSAKKTAGWRFLFEPSMTSLWNAISEVLFSDTRAPGGGAEDARQRAQTIAPVVWLLGKTGAGKTAIVAALTGDPRAQVGEGFEPCTRTAAFYDVPPEAPLLRFLDTRGLGEADYDPANDIAWCEEQSHLLLVVMQVADPVQHTVLRALHHARRRHPDWPVVVAQTGPAPSLSRRHGASCTISLYGRRARMRRGSYRTHCGRRSSISAGCSMICPARARASCRSISPCRKTDFHRTTTGSRCFGASFRRSGPKPSRRCTSPASTPRATRCERKPGR